MIDFLTSIWAWVNANNGGLMLIVVVIGSISAFVAKLSSGISVENMLRDPASWQTLAKQYQGTGSDAYFQSLGRVLGLANRYYGKGLLSWRAYGTCLTLAFTYPLLALLLGWGLFNISEPAGLALFSDIDNGFERAWRLLLFIAGFSASIYIMRDANNFSNYNVDRPFKPLGDPTLRPGLLSKAGPAAYLTVTCIVVLAFFVTLSFARAVVYAVVIVFVFVFAFADAITGTDTDTDTDTGAGAGACYVACALFFILCLHISAAFLLFFLYLLVPILNAAADLLSLAITRFFLTRVVTQRPAGWVILLQLGLDLVLAAICLALLIGGLIGAIELWAVISPGTAPLDWRAFGASIQADPKQGISLYLMAATTLIPTVVHVFAGLRAFLTQKSRLLRRAARKLTEKCAEPPPAKPFSEVEIDQMLRDIKRANLWGYASAGFVVAPVTAILLWAAYRFITDYVLI